MFDEAIKAAGFTSANSPVFHDVRSLTLALASEAGCPNDTITQATEYRTVDMVKHYQEGYELPFENVEVQYTAARRGGGLKH